MLVRLPHSSVEPMMPQQHHQPAHGRRTGLLEMRLRPVGPDRLALALPEP
jgi:hypothetical protein